MEFLQGVVVFANLAKQKQNQHHNSEPEKVGCNCNEPEKVGCNCSEPEKSGLHSLPLAHRKAVFVLNMHLKHFD